MTSSLLTGSGAASAVGALRRELAELLLDARERTMLLISPVGEEDLHRQHDPLMGPILWDLGHIAHFEELWLTRNLEGPIQFVEMPGIFNPMENPRRTRGALVLPALTDVLRTMQEIRARVLERLETADVAGGPPLLHDGYVYRLVAQHEFQHDETILQTLQLKQGEPYAAPRTIVPPPGRVLAEPVAMVHFPGGTVALGTDDRGWAYDNERPRHTVEIAPFQIDATPVTNGAYLEFMADGGYDRPELWTREGWSWRTEADARSPKYWSHTDADGWTLRVMDRTRPVDPLRPVCHVCWYEADAFARWAGRRLPTEAEWEAAATWDPATGTQRRYPWGDAPLTPERANVDQLAFDTAQIGAYAENVSPIGCYGMIGDVWEWTASDFTGYPGFEAFPYPEYSAVFFGPEYKVLRGGSWATRPGALRSTFRNWDYPIRRQIFSGFRCAQDA